MNFSFFTKQTILWRSWLPRFRQGTLTDDDFDWILCYVYVLGLAPSVVGLMILDVEGSSGDSASKLAIAVFFVPVFLGYMFLGSRRAPRKSLLVKVLRAMGGVCNAAFFSLVCVGYVGFWNAFTGPSEEILVSGPVVKLKAKSGRYLGALYEVTLRYDNRNVELTVPRKEYVALQKGDTYGRKMKLGGLGYYYTWGIAWWK